MPARVADADEATADVTSRELRTRREPEMSDIAKRGSEEEEIKRRVIEQLDALGVRDKLKVLDFSRELAARGPAGPQQPRSVGATGGAVLAFAGTIPKDDLEEIRRAVEEDCEKVDEEGW
ncbi:MAG: hypothetical protein M3Q49_08035 [Actinomycetota bacterium]|nr:hypothetical protein [Actinomycetota bacterium]